jgi:hypothetical protein
MAMNMRSTRILHRTREPSLVLMSKMFRDWLIDICVFSTCTVISDDPTGRIVGF